MSSTWVRAREKNNQPARKKSQNRNISPIWGEAPAEWIEIKNLHWCRSRGHDHGRQVQI